MTIDLATGRRHDWGAAPASSSHLRGSRDGRRLLLLELARGIGWDFVVRFPDGRSRRIMVDDGPWFRLGERDVLVGWRLPARRGAVRRFETQLVRLDLETGRAIERRRVPMVVQVSRDTSRLACVEWTKDESGLVPSVVVVEGGARRVVIPSTELLGWASPASDDPRPWGTGDLVEPTGDAPQKPSLPWLIVDPDFRGAAWLRADVERRILRRELHVVDLATGESRRLLGADSLPTTSMRSRDDERVQLLGLTPDGAAVRLQSDGETLVVDLASGAAVVVGPARGEASPSGRLQAWPSGDAEWRTRRPDGREIARGVRRTADIDWIDEDRWLVTTEGGVVQVVDVDSGRRSVLLP